MTVSLQQTCTRFQRIIRSYPRIFPRRIIGNLSIEPVSVVRFWERERESSVEVTGKRITESLEWPNKKPGPGKSFEKIRTFTEVVNGKRRVHDRSVYNKEMSTVF